MMKHWKDMKNYFKQWFGSKPVDSTDEELIVSGDETLLLSSDTSHAMRMAFWVIVVGFGGFILWANFSPLDEGATSSGTVNVEFHRRNIQHMTGGVVQEILAKEGQEVEEGQVLVRLNQTNARSQLSINQQQVSYFDRQLRSLKSMVDEGYYPLLNYQDFLRQKGEAQLRANMAQEELDRTEIRSPISGRVMGINITMGGVVTPGMKIMEVVPDEEGLVVEAKIAPHLIDRIHPGLAAQVRFSALNQRTTPIVDGTVEWVSADKFTNSNSDPSMVNRMLPDGYYTAKIRLDPEELKKLGDQSLYPGMPADVIVKLGNRTFMSYLIKPFTDRAALSMKER
jgi:protease secretion system membrane fusion protein